MDDATPDQPRESFPSAHRFLESADTVADGFEALTKEMLTTGQLGQSARAVYEELGTALSLLYRAGTCYWGCQQTGHNIENLAGRVYTFASAALRLTLFGYYDQALGLVRSIAEIVNMMQLFSLQPSKLEEWISMGSNQRRKAFSPFEIRTAIEKLSTPYVDKDTYSWLCEVGVHPTPVSAALSHDASGQLYAGTQFSRTGIMLVLNQVLWEQR